MAKRRSMLDGYFPAESPKEARQRREKARHEERKAGRVTYELPPEVKAEVARRAEKLGVPPARVAAAYLMDALMRDELELKKLVKDWKNIKYKSDLNLSELLKRFLDSIPPT